MYTISLLGGCISYSKTVPWYVCKHAFELDLETRHASMLKLGSKLDNNQTASQLLDTYIPMQLMPVLTVWPIIYEALGILPGKTRILVDVRTRTDIYWERTQKSGRVVKSNLFSVKRFWQLCKN